MIWNHPIAQRAWGGAARHRYGRGHRREGSTLDVEPDAVFSAEHDTEVTWIVEQYSEP